MGLVFPVLLFPSSWVQEEKRQDMVVSRGKRERERERERKGDRNGEIESVIVK